MSAFTHMAFIAFIFALFMTFVTCKFKLDSKTEAKLFANVFNALPKSETSNLLISPSGLRRALATMRIGASKPTAELLAKNGEFTSPNSDVVNKMGSALKDLRDIKQNQSTFYTLSNNNVHHKYKSRLTEDLGFQHQIVENLNAAQVNEWIRKRSDERIQSFIHSKDIDADTTHLIVDILNFNAKWKAPFARALTEYFYNVTGRYDVEMYEQTNEFLHGSLNSDGLPASAVLLPFEGDQTEMLILLPDERNGLDDLLEQLKDQDITKIKSKLSTETVRVYFPKLKLNIEDSVQDAVEKIGMREVFSDKGQFERLQYSVDVRAKKLQQVVDFDSTMTGVSAIAVSSVEWEKREKTVLYANEIKEKPINNSVYSASSLRYLDVDHPFFYAIIYKKNILFAGTIRNI